MWDHTESTSNKTPGCEPGYISESHGQIFKKSWITGLGRIPKGVPNPLRGEEEGREGKEFGRG